MDNTMNSAQNAHENKLPENAVIYRGGNCTLETIDGRAYFRTDGQRYRLSSHPYEPCTYLIDENEQQKTIHNAFEIGSALREFGSGRTLRAITGTVYDAAAFCRLLGQAAAYAGDEVDIDYLEAMQIVDAVRARGAVSKETARDPAELGLAGSKYLPRLLHAKKIRRTKDGRCYAG